MKGIFVLLIFLAVSTFRKKEACKTTTTNNGRQDTIADQNLIHDSGEQDTTGADDVELHSPSSPVDGLGNLRPLSPLGKPQQSTTPQNQDSPPVISTSHAGPSDRPSQRPEFDTGAVPQVRPQEPDRNNGEFGQGTELEEGSRRPKLYNPFRKPHSYSQMTDEDENSNVDRDRVHSDEQNTNSEQNVDSETTEPETQSNTIKGSVLGRPKSIANIFPRPSLGTPKHSYYELQEQTNENVEVDTELHPREIKCDLLVVGGGPEAAAVAAQLHLFKPRKPKKGQKEILPLKEGTKVVFVGDNPVFAVGVPYDDKVVSMEHLLNVIELDKVPVNGDKNDFKNWAEKEAERTESEERRKILLNTAVTYPEPPPRLIVGEYLTQSFHKSIRKLKDEKNFEIVLMNGTTAEEIAPNDQRDASIVKLSNGVTIEAPFVLLATGHFFPSRFPGTVNGYYESPWPSDRLKEIPAVHIGILGNSQSSTDAIVSLAHNFGSFEKLGDGSFEYKCNNPDYRAFKITAYSRTGHLPRIKRWFGLKHEPKNLTEINLRSLAGGPTAFETVFRWLKDEITTLLPFIKDNANADSMGVVEFFDHLEEKTNEKWGTPQERFVNDVKGLTSTNVKNELMFLGQIFDSLDPFYAKIMKSFTAEQFILFNEHILPRIVKAKTRLPLVNARKLHALILAKTPKEAGNEARLRFQDIGHKSRIKPKHDDRGVFLEYGENYKHNANHDYFIDALGQTGHISKDIRKLTRTLLKNGLAKPALYRYADQKYAMEVSEGDKAEDEQYAREKNRIVKGKTDGVYYYEGDGIQMHGFTLRPVSEDFSGVIYAAGPFTSSHSPFPKNLENTVRYAEFVVRHMTNEVARRREATGNV